jgi:2-isopropylmalate synthase
VLAEVKQREALGWSYEAADASFGLLLRRCAGLLAPEDEPFRTLHFRVSVSGGSDEQGPRAEATVAVEVAGERRLGVRARATVRSTRSTRRSATP